MSKTRKITNEKPSKAKKSTEKFKQEPKPRPKCMQGDRHIVSQIILSVQKTDCNAAKSIKQLRKLYTTMGHKDFLASFMKKVNFFLMRPEHVKHTPRVLKFLGLFVASFGEENDDVGKSHPIIKSVFDKILSITSESYFIRARICFLVMQIMTSFSQQAKIDMELWNAVIARMIGVFLKDISPVVRQNAIMALQRLQDPDHGEASGEDQVTKAYLYHMEADPVAKVRQSVVTAIAKKINTIPHVIERLRDNDEKVRRHTYLQMASYPVKSYKIRDRINIMTAGLYDRSEMVKQVVNNVLLPNWLASYENNFVDYIRAIKLDANDQEVKKFRDLAQDALNAVFKKFKVADLFKFLSISSENEYSNCFSIERTSSLEWLIVWKAAIKFHHDYVVGKQQDEHDEEAGERPIDEDEMISSIENMEIVPELSVFCDYMEKFVNNSKVNPTDADAKLRIMTFNHCLIVLLEIVQMYDLSDENGRNRLQTTLKKVLLEHEVSDHAIKEIAHVIEKLVPDVELRLNFFNDIVTNLVNHGPLTEYSRQITIEDLYDKAIDAQKRDAQKKDQCIRQLKKIKEFVYTKGYAEAHVTEEYAVMYADLIELLRPSAEQSISPSQTIVDSFPTAIVAKEETSLRVLKSLRICYYAIVAKGVNTGNSLTPEIHKTYNSFIRIHLESSDTTVRSWALKTATAYSLLYEPAAKEVYDILKSQLFKSSKNQTWAVTVECIIDLLLRYTIDKMDRYDLTETRTSTNNLTRSWKDWLDTDAGEDEEEMDLISSVSFTQLMSHLMENNVDLELHKILLVGFCKLILSLVLSGQLYKNEILSKFLLDYFNPATDVEVSRTSVKDIIIKEEQEYLEDALVPTLFMLLEAPLNRPLHEINQETVIRYVIGATRPISMKTNPENKDIISAFSREMMSLEVGDDPLLKKDIIAQTLLKWMKLEFLNKQKTRLNDIQDPFADVQMQVDNIQDPLAEAQVPLNDIQAPIVDAQMEVDEEVARLEVPVAPIAGVKEKNREKIRLKVEIFLKTRTKVKEAAVIIDKNVDGVLCFYYLCPFCVPVAAYPGQATLKNVSKRGEQKIMTSNGYISFRIFNVERHFNKMHKSLVKVQQQANKIPARTNET